jgi:hypothetical protein
MRKAIRLNIKVFIEGEDEPAHDFKKFTSEVVSEILSGTPSNFPGLTIQVKDVEEDTDWEDVETEEKI